MSDTSSKNQTYGLGTLFTKSWEYFTKEWQSIFTIILTIYVPINLILAFWPPRAGTGLNLNVEIIKSGYPQASILLSLFGLIATIAIILLVKRTIAGEKNDPWQLLRSAAEKWPRTIWTNIVLGVFVFGLTLLLIVPGIIYGLYWVFAVYAVVLYGKSGREALRYSRSVVTGRWWKVLGYLLVIGVLSVLQAMIVTHVLNFLLGFLPLTSISAWAAVDTFIISTVSQLAASYFAVVSAVWFMNLDETKLEVPVTSKTQHELASDL